MAVATAWVLSPRLPGGDEPHYLVITQSLLTDGDLRIGNNHERRDYAAYYPGTLQPDLIRKGTDGADLLDPRAGHLGPRATRVRAVRVSRCPGDDCAHGRRHGRAGLVCRLAATRDRRAAWFAWLAIAGSATFLIQSVTIFPDGPGSLAVAASAVLLVGLTSAERSASKAALVGSSVLLAVLPWLHTRFVVLAAGLATPILWQLFRDW